MFGKESTFGNHGKNEWVYRTSEKFKEGIKELEEGSEMTTQAKLILLAVTLGLKHACEFEVPISAYERTTDTLSKLGLFFWRSTEVEEFTKSHDDQEGQEPCVYLIAGNTPENINRAMENILAHIIGDVDHIRFGKAMDFPDTAVQAFNVYMRTRSEEILLPPLSEKLTDEEKAFSFFRFSQEYFEEEVVWLEQIIAGVKEYSPEIYRQVIEMYNSRQHSSQ